MYSTRWSETTFAGMSRIRCKLCSWQTQANQPRNALGRWAKLRALAWKHVCSAHPDTVPERFQAKKTNA